MKISTGPVYKYTPGTPLPSPTLLSNDQFVGQALAAFPPPRRVDEFTVKALTPSPAILAALAMSPVRPATSTPIVHPNATTLSPLLRASKVHVFSPGFPGQPTTGERVLDGVRAVSDLITPHLGPKMSVAISTLWLGVDTVSTVQTWRDPDSTPGERLDAAGQLTDSGAAFVAGLFGSPQVQQMATGIHFAALIGDKVHTGHMAFSQSELAEISGQPQSDELASILKLSEVLLPATTP